MAPVGFQERSTAAPLRGARSIATKERPFERTQRVEGLGALQLRLQLVEGNRVAIEANPSRPIRAESLFQTWSASSQVRRIAYAAECQGGLEEREGRQRVGRIFGSFEKTLEAESRIVGTTPIEIVGTKQIGGLDAGAGVIEASGDFLEALVTAFFLGFFQ